MPIRLRLTIWYTGLLAASLLLFGLIIYSLLGQVLRTDVDQTIRSQSNQATAIYERELDPSRALRSGNIPLRTEIIFTEQVFAQVVALPEGTAVRSSSNLGDYTLPLNQDALEVNLSGRSVFYNHVDGSAHLRIFSQPIKNADGEVVGAMQVAQSLAAIDATLRAARYAMLGGGLVALVVAAAIGVFLARTALQPIDQITQTALNITQRADLGERIHTSAPSNDEVGRLATVFNDMLERLQRLFETQQRLVADVSHELRTPLTTTQGNLDLLRRGAINDPPLRAEAIQAIEGEVQRMSRLVADLLLLAQADAGIRIEPKPVEMDTLLLDVYRQAMMMAASTGVGVRLGHEDQAVVQGDADRLRQVLVNLVANALKYTPDGGKVTLSLYNDPEWVKVSVTDTGVGIAPEDLPHIFDRFYRSRRRAVHGQAGTGLGLAIAKWVADAHDGHLTVDSEVGKGSTFILWLPKRAPVEANGNSSPLAESKPSASRLLLKGDSSQ